MTGMSWGMCYNTFQYAGFDNSSRTSQRNVVFNFKFVKMMSAPFRSWKILSPSKNALKPLWLPQLYSYCISETKKLIPHLYIHPRNERFPKQIQGTTKSQVNYVLGNFFIFLFFLIIIEN